LFLAAECWQESFNGLYFNWRFTLKVNSLKELYLEELKDTYDAEKQIVKALPKLVNAA